MIQTENGPQTLTWEQVQARKKRREITHVINTDDDAVKALRLADTALREAKLIGSAEEQTTAQAAYDEAEAAVRDAALVFRLRALPRKGDRSFAVLKAEHPPTDADHKDGQEATGDPKYRATWHRDTFAPALVAASLVEPQVTVEQATEWAEDWNEAEWSGLYSAALDVNQQATDTGGLVFS